MAQQQVRILMFPRHGRSTAAERRVRRWRADQLLDRCNPAQCVAVGAADSARGPTRAARRLCRRDQLEENRIGDVHTRVGLSRIYGVVLDARVGR